MGDGDGEDYHLSSAAKTILCIWLIVELLFVLWFVLVYYYGFSEHRRDSVQRIYQSLRLATLFGIILDLQWPITRLWYRYHIIRVICDSAEFLYTCIMASVMATVIYRILHYYHTIRVAYNSKAFCDDTLTAFDDHYTVIQPLNGISEHKHTRQSTPTHPLKIDKNEYNSRMWHRRFIVMWLFLTIVFALTELAYFISLAYDWGNGGNRLTFRILKYYTYFFMVVSLLFFSFLLHILQNMNRILGAHTRFLKSQLTRTQNIDTNYSDTSSTNGYTPPLQPHQLNTNLNENRMDSNNGVTIPSEQNQILLKSRVEKSEKLLRRLFRLIFGFTFFIFILVVSYTTVFITGDANRIHSWWLWEWMHQGFSHAVLYCTLMYYLQLKKDRPHYSTVGANAINTSPAAYVPITVDSNSALATFNSTSVANDISTATDSVLDGSAVQSDVTTVSMPSPDSHESTPKQKKGKRKKKNFRSVNEEWDASLSIIMSATNSASERSMPETNDV